MSNQIQIFDFNSNQVRIQIINNKEYFCAKDVCDILGYSNGRDAIEKHCKPRGVAKRDTLTNGGMQQLSYIDEPNLYRLISHSKLPSAEKFEAWVFEEILNLKSGSLIKSCQLFAKQESLKFNNLHKENKFYCLQKI